MIISVASGKGGTGKATMAGALAFLAQQSVIADCDVDAAELASALCLKATQAGVNYLNLIYVEGVCFDRGKITGVVGKRTLVSETLPIDPLTFKSRIVLDTTGHEACVVEKMRKRGLIPVAGSKDVWGEGPMNATEGEPFVVEKAGEIFPVLRVAGMSVCAAYGGPRMGPVFGEMLLSGQCVAELITKKL